MASIIEDMKQQLRRYDRKECFGWLHRVTPILVTQAVIVLYVIKSEDLYFDVTGIVNFNLFLLAIVTTSHLIIWEILDFVRNSAKDVLREYQCYNIKVLANVEEFAKTFQMYKMEASKPIGPVKSRGCSSQVTSDVEKGSDVNDTDVINDSLSSRSSSLSSVCVISSASESSYCVMTSSCSSTTSSNGTTENSTTDTEDSTQNSQENHLNRSITQSNEIKTPSNSLSHICGKNSPLNYSEINRLSDIPEHEADDTNMSRDAVATESRVIKANNRLKSLQDVYLVVDIFKALVCLDTMRHLWFYYSLYYWRMTAVQTISIFAVPSFVVLIEVSLTVLCFIS